MSEIVMETLRGLPFLSYKRNGKEGGEESTEGSGDRIGNREIAPDTLALDYLDEEGDAVEVWKDPFCLTATSPAVGKEMASAKEKRKQRGYLGNAIPLTSCIGVEGCLLLLDLDSSMSFFLFPILPSIYSLFFLFLESHPFTYLLSSCPWITLPLFLKPTYLSSA
jgi:hypothetical protein